MMRLAATGFVVLLVTWTAASAQPSDVGARNAAAAAAMKEGRYAEAAEIYRQLSQAIPDEPGLLMNLGMALAMSGREKEALAPLTRAVTLKPALVPAQLFLGSSHLALGQAAEAIGPLETVVKARPADVESRRLLAQAYAGAGKPAQALTHLRRITEIAPKLPQGWYSLGHVYNAVTQDAMSTFDNEPADSPWRRLLVADAFMLDGRFTDAFALYRETLEKLPAMVSIHDSLAQIYTQTGHPEWAAAERAKGTLPAASCATRKALCEYRAGRYRALLAATESAADPESRYWRARAGTELALQAFRQLDSLPDSRERRESRAELARAGRRFTDAVAEYEAALRLAPGDPALLAELGSTLVYARDYERAVATLAPLVKADGGNAALLAVYGRALFELQRLDEAIPALEKAVALEPSDLETRTSLGRARLQQGDFAAAIALIEPLLAADVDGSLHLQLARAYRGLGQADKAAPLLERGQQLQQGAAGAWRRRGRPSDHASGMRCLDHESPRRSR